MHFKSKALKILMAAIYWIQSSLLIPLLSFPLSYAVGKETQKILIRSSETSISDYLHFTKNHLEFLTPFPISPTEKEKALKNMYKLFEFEFLKEDISKATETLKKLTSLALDHPFSKPIQDILFLSFFRLAQLEPSESLKWLKKALTYNPFLEPNPHFVPISLIEKYKILKSRTLFLDISSQENQLVNGSFEISQVIPSAIYRIDIFDTLSGHRTKFMTGRQINSLTKTPPLVQGNCHKHSLTSPIPQNLKDRKNYYVFLGSQCSPKNLSQFYKTSKKTKGLNLTSKSLPSQKISATPTSRSLQWTLNQEFFPSPSSPLSIDSTQKPLSLESIKNKSSKKRNGQWIYILSGIATIALGAIIINQTHKSSKPQAYKARSTQEF